MRSLSILLASAAIAAAGWAPSRLSVAELKPEKVRTADSKKNQLYLHDGLFVGGDRAIDGVVIKDIRHAVNAGYERVVIDLAATRNGEPAAIPRAPYYQLAVNPDERRLVFTVWGKPRLEFDAKKVQAAFRKSAAVRGVSLLPRIEEDAWSFVLELKGDSPVEAFELSGPVRVILDIKTPSSVGAPQAPARKAKAAVRKQAHAPKPARPANGAHGAFDSHGALDAVPETGAQPDPEARPARGKPSHDPESEDPQENHG